MQSGEVQSTVVPDLPGPESEITSDKSVASICFDIGRGQVCSISSFAKNSQLFPLRRLRSELPRAALPASQVQWKSAVKEDSFWSLHRIFTLPCTDPYFRKFSQLSGAHNRTKRVDISVSCVARLPLFQCSSRRLQKCISIYTEPSKDCIDILARL